MAVQRRSFDVEVLERLRSVSCLEAFGRLDGHFKRDVTFVPTKDPHTERWHCATAQGDYELLVNGPKWYDTSHDNAVAESFFQLLKRERIRRQIYPTRQAARSDVFD